MPAKNLFFFITLLTLYFFAYTPIYAQGNNPWFEPSSLSISQEKDACRDDNVLSVGCYTHLITVLIPAGIGCQVMRDPNPETAIFTPCDPPKTQEDGKLNYQRTAIGQVSNLIAATYTPPASTAYFALDLAQNIGLPPAYAQGIGFGGLIPILPIWKAFRNIAYVVLIVVLIVIGFMIMFRVKIDPRTVITVQQSLPRVVIALLLITFSYAIVGFLIDLMYLAILLVIAVINQELPEVFPLQETQSMYLTGGWSTLLNALFNIIPREKWNAALLQLAFIVAGHYGGHITVAGFSMGPGLGALIGALIGGAALWARGGAGPIEELVGTGLAPFIYLLIGLGLLFMFVRILFLLINAYIQVIVGIIFGPIQILFDAFPTGGGHFSAWFKNIIANLAVFPTVVALLILGSAITATLTPTGAFTGFWTPPLIPGWTPNAIKFVIGIGIITLIPNVAGAMKERLQAKPMLPMGIGTPLAPFVSGAQTALGVGSQFFYFQHTLGFLRGALGRGRPKPQHT